MDGMKTATFKAVSDSDDVVDPEDASCLRLRCGHAFHAACVLAAFRAGLGCAMCRQPLVVGGGAALEHELYDDGEQYSEDEEAQDDEYDGATAAETAAMREAHVALQRLRTSRRAVREARTAVNTALRDHNVLCEGVRQERAAVLRAALTNFRRRLQPAFRTSLHRLQESLERVQREERQALLDHGVDGRTVDAYFRHTAPIEYSARTRTRTLADADPLSRRFWNH